MKTYLLCSHPASLDSVETEFLHHLRTFKKAMIAETSFIASQWKIFSGVLAVAIFSVADLAVPSQSVEDYSLKALLIVALVFVVRLLLVQQKEHKQELKELRDRHETAMQNVVKANTESNQRVADLAEEQATYFKTVTRSIMDEKLKNVPKAS